MTVDVVYRDAAAFQFVTNHISIHGWADPGTAADKGGGNDQLDFNIKAPRLQAYVQPLQELGVIVLPDTKCRSV